VLNRYFQTNETADGVIEFIGEANKAALEDHFGVPAHVWGDGPHDMFGPSTCNYHNLLRKIKKSFDPNVASDSSHYITPKD